MRRGRLPLTSLRSFEAAGRLLSLTSAAQELCVSQAAVSRQVRELEDHLGQAVFERRHRRVELTPAGRRLLVQLTSSFDDIDREVSALRDAPARPVLVASVEPAFAACWLVPRLPRFRELRPDIDVAVEADMRLADFRGQGAHVAIRCSAEVRAWPRTNAQHLADIVLVPVLAPGLLAGEKELAAPADLADYTLLHEENRDGWTRWFHEAGVTDVVPERGPIFTDGALAVQAALRGHGVALADLLWVREDIEAGRLMIPFEVRIDWGAYWLITPEQKRLGEPARAFSAWLAEECSTAR